MNPRRRPLIPLVGFLSATDPRVCATVAAIQKDLLLHGFVRRYEPDRNSNVDGLPAGEGAFLPCTFWPADNLLLQGRADEDDGLPEARHHWSRLARSTLSARSSTFSTEKPYLLMTTPPGAEAPNPSTLTVSPVSPTY